MHSLLPCCLYVRGNKAGAGARKRSLCWGGLGLEAGSRQHWLRRAASPPHAAAPPRGCWGRGVRAGKAAVKQHLSVGGSELPTDRGCSTSHGSLCGEPGPTADRGWSRQQPLSQGGSAQAHSRQELLNTEAAVQGDWKLSRSGAGVYWLAALIPRQYRIIV